MSSGFIEDGLIHYQTIGLLVPERLPAPPSILRRLDSLIEDFGGKATKVSEVIFDATAGTLVFTKGKPIKLGSSEKYVLEILVNAKATRQSFGPDLQKDANDRPDRVLRRLLKNLAS